MIRKWVVGECLEKMQDIETGSVDMILCDLPYGTTANKWDNVIPFKPLWEQYWRVCKPNAAIVLTAQCPFDKVLGVSQLDYLKYEWIWKKNHATGHLNAKKSPMKAHENILVFYKSLPNYYPQKTTGHKRKIAKKTKDLGDVYNKQSFSSLMYDSTERYPISVLEFSSDKQESSIHPTQKPISLFEYLIKTYTNDGDLVLDNCAGSGTTAVACDNLSRQWICIEQSQKYSDLAQERIADNNHRLI